MSTCTMYTTLHYNHVPVITCRLYFIQIMVHIKIPFQYEAATPGDRERGPE